MSRGKGVQPKEVLISPDQVLSVPAKKPEKINLGDTAALKRALDDVVHKAAHSAGYEINYMYTDIKIVLGVLTCAVACVGQFWPAKRPDSQAVLLACVAVYVVLSVIFNAFHSFVEKDTTALLNTPPGHVSLVLRSKLPRYQDVYTLGVRPKGAAPGGPKDVVLEKSVGAYFDSDGILAGEVLTADVVQLLNKAAGGVQSKKST